MLQFDAETSALLDRAYRGRDFQRRRLAAIDALDPKPGDRLLDIGCGTGLMVEELSRAVGEEGHVTGLDPSADMLATAEARTAGIANAALVAGDTGALPFEDGAFDGAVSVQVFEYIDDLPTALAECRRVLRPGARLVIGDMDFDTFSWHSADPDRMARMMRAYDAHLARRTVPRVLPGLLPGAGFAHRASLPVPFLDTTRGPDGMARMVQILMEAFGRASDDLSEADVRDWSAEQDALAAAGAFYFAITHVVTVAEAI